MRARECQNVEYKTSWHDKYLEWICGFANAQGAVMYFSVNDDHEVVGIDNIDRLMEFQRNNVVKTATENATESATVNATESATVKINKTQEKIMAILHVDKFATYDVIAKQLGVERTTVWRNIKKLQEIGRLRRIGGDNGGYWDEI